MSETDEQVLARIWRQATAPLDDREATDPNTQEWNAVIESGKPRYKGAATPDPIEVERVASEPDEWAGIRAAHGRNDYFKAPVFRRVQRRID